MTGSTYYAARAWTCPAGHAGPRGEPLRMIVPAGLGLAPACTTCRQPMTSVGELLEGSWRIDDCCTPAGPGGRWAGPPRDPAACTTCFGTRCRALCLACYATGCDGRHDECLACDGTGTEDCPACEGEGLTFGQHGEETGPCTAPGCDNGRVPCAACRPAAS